MNKKIKNLLKRIIPNSVIIRKLNKSNNMLLLTFDDGPHAHITPQILNLLEKFEVRAIFFVIGEFVRKYPELLLEIKKRGHIIGNHTYGHPNFRIRSYSEYMTELIKTQNLIQELTGEKPKYFRPPMGVISFKGIFAAKKMKMKIVLWSCEGGEWGLYEQNDAKTIAKRLLRTVNYSDIILLHDNNLKVVEILNKILPMLKQKNYNMSAGVNYLP
jgi:peptidoglycan/xylan/chitin deacetylase (PgdA/CDA1 family)